MSGKKSSATTRRAIRSSILGAMATTLDNDAFGTGAGYLYDVMDDLPDAERRAYEERVRSVAREIIDEFSHRAERLTR